MSRNSFEKDIEKQIKNKGAKVSYEPEKIPYTSYYIPDFLVVPKSKRKKSFYLECKGFFRREHKTKMTNFKRSNPDIDLRIIFQRFNKKDIKWSEKNKFLYAIKDIPKEWL